LDHEDLTSTSADRPAIDRKAEERIRGSSYLALRAISCVASDDVVTVHGYLPSYYLKQVAQEIVSGVEGVRHVVNRIVVLGQGTTGPSSQARPTV
jgi:osmotically-inducible protein OsmY